MICPNCGGAIRDGSNFCSKCGNAIPDNQGHSGNVPETIFPQEQPYVDPNICPVQERREGGYATYANPIGGYILSALLIIVFFISGRGIVWLIGAVVFALIAAFSPMKRNYCPHCFYRKPFNAKTCSNCGHRDTSACPSWLSAIIIIGLAIACIVIIVLSSV